MTNYNSTQDILLITHKLRVYTQDIPLIEALLSCMQQGLDLPANIEYAIKRAFSVHPDIIGKNTTVTRAQYKIAQKVYQQILIEHYFIKRTHLTTSKPYIPMLHGVLYHILAFGVIQLHALPHTHQIPEHCEN